MIYNEIESSGALVDVARLHEICGLGKAVSFVPQDLTKIVNIIKTVEVTKIEISDVLVRFRFARACIPKPLSLTELLRDV